MNKTEYIINSFKKININISELQAELFCRYYEMLTEKNKVMNLTAITEFPEVVEKHFLDSCIASSELDITLLDSLKKRLLFLDSVIAELHLDQIKTFHSRAEDGGKNPLLREQFDICVSRAVANMSSLAEYCVPFIKIGGYFYAYKSDVEDEIHSAEKAIRILGGNTDDIISCSLPDSGSRRMIVKIKKNKKTPAQYPRKAGIPGKEPIQ